MIKSLKTRKRHKLNKQEILRYWISFEDLIYVQLIFYVQGGQLLEAAIQRQSLEKKFWKYAANLQENTHVAVRFQ